MAMTPYSRNTSGKSHYFDHYDKSTLVTMFPLSQVSLGGIITSHGDFHSPTGHAYKKQAWRGYYGSVVSVFGGKLSTERNGAMPYSYSSVTSLLSTTADPNALNSAISDAYEKLRGSVDLSIDLVQWRQVVAMMSGYRRLKSGIVSAAASLVIPVEKAERLTAEVKRERRRRRAKRLTRELNQTLNYIAEKRLEYVFGWKPTMGSIYDLALKAITPQEPGHLRVEGKGKVVINRQAVNFSIDSKVPIIHTIQESSRARVVMYYTPIGDVLEKLSEITSLNPASITYELIPFSFVLDWAIDVGGWIRSLETAYVHRNNFAGGYQTVTTRYTVSSSMNGRNQTSPGNFTTYDLRGSMVQSSLNRVGLNGAPFQARPVRQFSLGASRALTAIALAKVTLLRADNLLAGRR